MRLFRVLQVHKGKTVLLFIFTLVVLLGTACGGDDNPEPMVNPTATPVAMVIPGPTVSPTATPVAMVIPGPMVSPTAAPQATVTPEPTVSPTATPEATATPEPMVGSIATAEATAAPAPMPNLTPSPVSPASGQYYVNIDLGTTWQEVFDTLSPLEQSCIRNAFGDELEWTLGKTVSNDTSYFSDWEVRLYTCLDPEVARAVFFSATKASLEEYGEWSEDEFSCTQELISDVNVAALIAAPDDSAELVEFWVSLIFCVPDLLVSGYILEWGLSLEDVSEEEASCLRGKADDIDAAAIITNIDDSAKDEFLASLASCLPNLPLYLTLSEFRLSPRDLTEEEISCLREVEPSEYETLGVYLASCVPYLLVRVMLSELDLSLDDLTEDEISCLREHKDEIGVGYGSITPQEGAENGESIASPVFCVPDLFIFVMLWTWGLSPEDLSDEETSCLREQLTETGLVTALAAPEDSAEYEEFVASLVTCVPELAEWDDKGK